MNRHGQQLSLTGIRDPDKRGMASPGSGYLKPEARQDTQDLAGRESSQAGHQDLTAAVS